MHQTETKKVMLSWQKAEIFKPKNPHCKKYLQKKKKKANVADGRFFLQNFEKVCIILLIIFS